MHPPSFSSPSSSSTFTSRCHFIIFCVWPLTRVSLSPLACFSNTQQHLWERLVSNRKQENTLRPQSGKTVDWLQEDSVRVCSWDLFPSLMTNKYEGKKRLYVIVKQNVFLRVWKTTTELNKEKTPEEDVAPASSGGICVPAEF